MEYKKLIPVNGCKVRVPYQHRHLSEKGERMPMTVYWKRQIEAGKVREMNEQLPLNFKKETD